MWIPYFHHSTSWVSYFYSLSIETELENEVDQIQRDVDFDENKIIFHYGRNKFGGEIKTFTEIWDLVDVIDNAKISSRERLEALEAFWIFGSQKLINIEKLFKLGVIKHATIR